MRVLLAILVISMTVMTASAALSCYGDKDKCEEEECCIQIGNTPFGRCKPRIDVDDICEIKPLKNLFHKHVYLLRCPCHEGLKCVGKEGIVGKLAGRCQAQSGETEGTQKPEPETETQPETEE